jgi:HlyD family secretion protein
VDTETNPSTAPDLSATLDYGRPQAPWKRWALWGVIALAAIVVGYLIFGGDGVTAANYTTQPVTRGDLTVTVTATGNLEPRNQVDIGSELSGTVRSVMADVNDTVKAGQVLATLDTSRLEAQVLQAQSSLTSAEARVVQSVAGLKEARANYARLQKVRELSGNKLPSQQDMDVAESAVARAEGEEAAARAAVAQARANLDVIKTDLGKTAIRSPINGIVLVRSVEPGQTVAASLQAPVLFTLAEDLKKMELHVSVDEADIGSVEVGQQATFSVDAFPNRQFQARITRVYFASNNTQKSASGSSSQGSGASSATSTGVVTYETVLEVDNSDLSLRPGMTATAEIVTTNIEGATLVPNAALRFTPEGVDVPGAPPSAQSRGPLTALMPQMPRRFFGAGQQGGPRRLARAWVIENGKPELVLFRAGASDGRMTQVLERGELPTGGRMAQMANDEKFKQALERRLEPGTKVIVDEEAPKQ